MNHRDRRSICNPLPVPSYPRGRNSRLGKGNAFGWIRDTRNDFRELADPTVIYHDNKWYLYPSCGMAWVSEDFASWRHVPLDPYDIGYAPTVVKHIDRFLLMASNSDVYSSADPLGPFVNCGPLRQADGSPIARLGDFNDPMLFSDDDGRLYAYWGLGQPGIFVAEVDPVTCTRLLAQPRIVFTYDPSVKWERYGEYNEDRSRSFIEGPWMIKVNREYYLTYAAPGTEWRTYGMGAARSRSPLGPFIRQTNNPFCAKVDGLIQGPGHGCIVRGPRDTLWAFYTCRVCYEHIFERRIGLDPCGIDRDGNLFVSVSETPQRVPGAIDQPDKGNTFDISPVNHRRAATVSSSAEGRDPLYAVDNCMHTWWQPSGSDRLPFYEQDLGFLATISSMRVIWRDIGLDYDKGIIPGPIGYTLEISLDGKDWTTACESDAAGPDMLVDYQEFSPCVARHVRLRILSWPAGLALGLTDFSVFGMA